MLRIRLLIQSQGPYLFFPYPLSVSVEARGWHSQKRFLQPLCDLCENMPLTCKYGFCFWTAAAVSLPSQQSQVWGPPSSREGPSPARPPLFLPQPRRCTASLMRELDLIQSFSLPGGLPENKWLMKVCFVAVTHRRIMLSDQVIWVWFALSSAYCVRLTSSDQFIRLCEYFSQRQ